MKSYREAEGVEILRLLYENPDIPVALDTETSGLGVASGADWCIGVSIAFLHEGRGYSHYFAFAHRTGENCSKRTRDMLGYVLLQPRMLIFANAEFDILSVGSMGYRLDESDFIDICTMAHLVDENRPYNKGVDSLALHYLGEKGKVEDPRIDEEKKNGWPTVTPEEMWDYAVMDAVSTWRIWDFLRRHADWVSLPEDIWPEKQKFIRVLIEMKRRGVLIDQEIAAEMAENGEAELKRIARELGYPAVPKKPTKMYPNPDPDPLPVLGPNALTEIFLERLGLPVLKASKVTGKPSFDKEVMEQYDTMLERLDSPEARLVKQYRGWQKAVSAAYRPYLELVDHDGRLRCSYKTHGTVTGRLSCSKPNLQQIPKESDKPWNGRVKECFIAKPGYVLLNADFSQLELRLATAYAQEPHLLEIFEEGRDIFTEMSERLGMTRNDTKTLVYSMQYGAGIPRIMAAFGVSEARAKEIRANYFATYPRFKALSDMFSNAAREAGRVRIWSGRYRKFFNPRKEYFKAMNSIIQGGAADIVERVMVRLFELVDSEDCQMLLQVHDSVAFEVREDLVEHYSALIHEVMEDVSGAVGHDNFAVRFAVDVGPWVLAA